MMRKKGQEDHARGGGKGRHIGKWRNRQIVRS
jgi:hypothetical protein